MKKIKSFFNREQNLLIHILAAITAVTLGICFKLTLLEWILVFFCIGLVISCELLNSAIELSVDSFTQEFNPLAMVAKDTSASAVVISAFIALFIGLYVFLPKFLSLFN